MQQPDPSDFAIDKGHAVLHHGISRSVLVMAFAVSLAGCASPATPSSDLAIGSPGSWAEEMAHERQKATSPEVKAALEDGVISDQEYAEMKERYTACLSAAGIVLTRYGFGGGAYTPPASMSHDQAHETETRCSEQSGEYPIGYFYREMRVNPSHKDLVPAIVACYKRHGLVGEGYGLKDYSAGDLPRGSDAVTAAANACDVDPDELLGG